MVKYRIGAGLGEYTEKNELISNILELALKVDDRPSGVVPERSNATKKVEALLSNSAVFGIKKLVKQKKSGHYFLNDKIELVKFLSLSEACSIFTDNDVEISSLRALKKNEDVRSIHPTQKKNLVDSFNMMLDFDKELGLSEELYTANKDYFYEYLRVSDDSLQFLADMANDFYFPYEMLGEVMDYRRLLMETASEHYTADLAFQKFIDNFTRIEDALLRFCMDYCKREMVYYDGEKARYPYNLKKYFHERHNLNIEDDTYDQHEEEEYARIYADDVLEMIAEVLENDL